mgnify:CR=1 FL=1
MRRACVANARDNAIANSDSENLSCGYTEDNQHTIKPDAAVRRRLETNQKVRPERFLPADEERNRQ